MDDIQAKLNLPEQPVRIKAEGNQKKIFDPVRKKWLELTPEEWVRQNWVLYLHHFLHYPLSHMETEKSMKLHQTLKRADIVLYDRKLKPFIIVECKAPGVKIGMDVFEQAGRYHMAMGVKFLLITNGIHHHAVKLANGKAAFAEHIPNYEEMDT